MGTSPLGPTFTGTGDLLRLVLRRDRLRLAIWVLAIVSIVAVAGASVVAVYDTTESLIGYANLIRDNAAMIVQSGPGHGLDDPTVGAVLVNENLMWSVIAVGLMSTFMVTRHTRTEEETGRSELVRAAPVGRHAPAAAAMIGAALANALVATGITVTLLALDLPTAGSIAYGLAVFAAGSVFAAITLVAGQVASSARAANGTAAALLGLSFALRAVGDVTGGPWSWLSPIGWAQAVRPYADERWWALGLPVVATVVLVAVADWLTSHRDLGAGLVPQRPGPPRAGERLSNPLGLAVRLHRGSLIGWTVGLGAFGLFYGAIAVEAEQLLVENPEFAEFFAQLGEGSITELFLATAVLMTAMIASGFAVSAALRMRSEEVDGRLEPVLAAPVSRRGWMASHLAVTVAGSVLVAGVAGVAMGLGFWMGSGDVGEIAPLLVASLVTVPALLVLAAVGVALFGLRPRWSGVAWAGVAGAVVIGLFAELLDLPQPARNLSPFTHVPAMPAASFSLLPLMTLLAVATALTAVGAIGLQRRDMS